MPRSDDGPRRRDRGRISATPRRANVAATWSPTTAARHTDAATTRTGRDQTARLKLRLLREGDVARARAAGCREGARTTQRPASCVLDRGYIAPAAAARCDLAPGDRSRRCCTGWCGSAPRRWLRAWGSSSHGVSELADFLMLQTPQPPRAGVAPGARGALPASARAAPAVACMLAGELSTLSSASRRPTDFPFYATRSAAVLRPAGRRHCASMLSTVLEQNAVQIELATASTACTWRWCPTPRWRAVPASCWRSTPSCRANSCASRFPAQTKRRPGRDASASSSTSTCPASGCGPLPVAPRQLPFHAGLPLLRARRQRRALAAVRAIGQPGAAHRRATSPGSRCELWAIRR